MSIAEDILSGALDPRRAAVGVQAYNAFIRALEQERKIEEQEEISGRVEVLERRVEAGGDGVVSIIRNRLKLEGEVPERCNE